MKIESIRETLVEAVSRAEKVAQKNPTLPVLAGLYLEAKDNRLVVRATNLDLALSITVPVKVHEPGIAVVPAQILNSFLNSLSKEKHITLEGTAQTITVTTETTRSVVNLLPPDDFPLIPEVVDADSFSMSAKDLVAGIKATVYAAAVGSIKPELSSICLAYDGTDLVFVATDSFRLAEKKIKVKKIPTFSQILIPQKNASEIARILDSVDEEVSITIEENQIALRTGSLYLTSRTIDGVFPDYKQIIPKEAVTTATVLKQDLVTSLKTSLIFSDPFNQLRLVVKPQDKHFEIESRNQNVGESTYTIPAALTGKDISISVNHRYFTDSFPSIATDSVEVSFSGEGRPILVKPVGDKSFMYLVMPMNRS